ncbi:hypothetical protein PHDIMM138B_20280 [Phytobacter diazotrophicus]
MIKKCILLSVAGLLSIQAHSYSKLPAPVVRKLEAMDSVKKLNCDEFEGFVFSKIDYAKLEVKGSFFKDTPVINGSSTICFLDHDFDDTTKPVLSVVERGIVEGVNFSLSRWGGSGSVGGEYLSPASWNLGCSTDAMTDDVTCYIFQKGFYIYRSKNGYSVIIGSEHFPQTTSFLRINKDAPIESQFNGVYSNDTSKNILVKLGSATAVTIRFTKWPNINPLDEVVDMTSFNAAKFMLDRIYENHI